MSKFLELHRKGQPLLLANVWSVGTAKLVASLGYEALATTSAGHAGDLGRRDGKVSRGEALAHARVIARATPLPVSADLENGFGDAPEDAAETVRLAAETGLAGCSIEDYGGEAIYPLDRARARIQAAAEEARKTDLVLTARAENYFRGIRDLADTIARLQAFQEAGAHVLFAPGLSDLDEIRRVVASVDLPVSVICLPGAPSVQELASVGVARLSVGSAFFNAALGAVAKAAREWREQGTHDFWQDAIVGLKAGKQAFD